MPAAINRNPSIQAMRIIGARFLILLPLHTLPQLRAARLLPSPHSFTQSAVDHFRPSPKSQIFGLALEHLCFFQLRFLFVDFSSLLRFKLCLS
jgi:hypothetical protein